MNISRVAIGVFFITFSLVAMFLGGTQLWTQQERISSAEETTVRITDSRVEKEIRKRDTDDDGIREREVSYYPEITYTYTYNGVQYTSESVYPSAFETSVSQNEAKETVENRKEGTRDTGYVVPEDPDKSFLVKESKTTGPLIFVVFGLIFGGVGLGVVTGRLDSSE